jgi:hypothetical protein
MAKVRRFLSHYLWFIFLFITLLMWLIVVSQPPTPAPLPTTKILLAESFDLSNSGLTKPRKFVIDSQGNFYVVNTEPNQIFKFSPQGELIMKWGRGIDGSISDFFNDISIDGNDIIYVLDSYDERNLQSVKRFDTAGRLLSRWSFTYGNDVINLAATKNGDFYLPVLFSGRSCYEYDGNRYNSKGEQLFQLAREYLRNVEKMFVDSEDNLYLFNSGNCGSYGASAKYKSGFGLTKINPDGTFARQWVKTFEESGFLSDFIVDKSGAVYISTLKYDFQNGKIIPKQTQIVTYSEYGEILSTWSEDWGETKITSNILVDFKVMLGTDKDGNIYSLSKNILSKFLQI